jgi:hypothetical protein
MMIRVCSLETHLFDLVADALMQGLGGGSYSQFCLPALVSQNLSQNIRLVLDGFLYCQQTDHVRWNDNVWFQF